MHGLRARVGGEGRGAFTETTIPRSPSTVPIQDDRHVNRSELSTTRKRVESLTTSWMDQVEEPLNIFGTAEVPKSRIPFLLLPFSTTMSVLLLWNGLHTPHFAVGSIEIAGKAMQSALRKKDMASMIQALKYLSSGKVETVPRSLTCRRCIKSMVTPGGCEVAKYIYTRRGQRCWPLHPYPAEVSPSTPPLPGLGYILRENRVFAPKKCLRDALI